MGNIEHNGQQIAAFGSVDPKTGVSRILQKWDQDFTFFLDSYGMSVSKRQYTALIQSLDSDRMEVLATVDADTGQILYTPLGNATDAFEYDEVNDTLLCLYNPVNSDSFWVTRIDPKTNTLTPLEPVVGYYHSLTSAMDSANHLYYLVTGNPCVLIVLLTIDSTTGKTVNMAQVEGGLVDLNGMTFDSVSGTLYCVLWNDNKEEELCTIDPINGNVTTLNVLSSHHYQGSVVSLTVDTAEQVLYVVILGSDSVHLVSIDLETDSFMNDVELGEDSLFYGLKYAP